MLIDNDLRRIEAVLGNGDDAQDFIRDISDHVQTLPAHQGRAYIEKALQDLEAGSDDYLEDAASP